jgi:hypothetical protein
LLDDTAPLRPEALQGHQQFLKSHPASPFRKISANFNRLRSALSRFSPAAPGAVTAFATYRFRGFSSCPLGGRGGERLRKSLSQGGENYQGQFRAFLAGSFFLS